ncbi:hypothetical protein DIPPA_08037 [Diplonema papillatum]|nr:hypothetical protein DIPPA_08037 [Diplonema papillatum]
MGCTNSKADERPKTDSAKPEKPVAGKDDLGTSGKWMKGYAVGQTVAGPATYVVRMLKDKEGAWEMMRGNAMGSSNGDASSQVTWVEPIEGQRVMEYEIKEDGDGVIRGGGWEADVQFINVTAEQRVMDIVRGESRIIGYRCNLSGPVAVGYPQPFPSTSSRISMPEKSPTRPFYSTEPPRFLEGDSLTTFKQGIFNITGDNGTYATVRAQAGRTIAVFIIQEIDMAIVAGFLAARTWLS